MTLPQEIIDKIFLLLDYATLEKSREIQSEYVLKRTQYGCIYSAIAYGNLENMKWLKQQGCPLNSKAFEFAAQNGNLENMKWLKEQGGPYPCNSRMLILAFRNGYTEIIDSLYGRGYFFSIQWGYDKNKPEIIRILPWLREHRYLRNSV